MRWYAVHTQPQGEPKANFNLKRQGFETFLPLYVKKRRHARRTEMVRAPLFPRYLFVAIDVERMAWRVINSTFGVVHLVCQGERPIAVPDPVMAALQERETCDGVIDLPARPAFQPGEKLRITEGPFADRIGLCEGVSDAQRVALLLELLGRQVRVLVAGDCVEAVA